MSEPPLILIVDDSRAARLYMRIHLDSAGFQVEEVAPDSAFDVLSAIDTLRPDLVVLDYEMPACNGESLLRLMREDPRFEAYRVMICSSHRDEALIRRLTRWRIAGYLVKPMRPEELVEAVQQALQNPRVGW